MSANVKCKGFLEQFQSRITRQEFLRSPECVGLYKAPCESETTTNTLPTLLYTMAPLKVIGAGYGRTGTDSLRTALNMLGYVY